MACKHSNQDQICCVNIVIVTRTKYGVKTKGNTCFLCPSWVLITYIICPPAIQYSEDLKPLQSRSKGTGPGSYGGYFNPVV